MPTRFESPSVGGRGDSYLEPAGWQAGIAYRRFTADEFYVGHEQHNELGPGKQGLDFHVHSVTLSASYAITERLALSLDVPWSTGTVSFIRADGKRHPMSASGLGDMHLVGSAWVWDPHDAPRGNISFGLGMKAPTGTHTATDYAWSANGDSTLVPADQSVQLGDGGWGVILKAQGFRQIRGSSFVYAAGEYLAATTTHTEVPGPRGPQQLLAVPDVYSIRAGATTGVPANHAVTLSLGMRQDATTRANLIGGKDMFFRRPAIVGYVDPGLSIARGRDTYFLNTPVRVYQNFRQDYFYKPGDGAPGGDLARYLLVMGYTYRW